MVLVWTEAARELEAARIDIELASELDDSSDSSVDDTLPQLPVASRVGGASSLARSRWRQISNRDGRQGTRSSKVCLPNSTLMLWYTLPYLDFFPPPLLPN